MRFNSYEWSTRYLPMLMLPLSMSLSLLGCSDVTETPEYQAACHGEPLKYKGERRRAREDGYIINEQYQCIDKASYTAIQSAEARWRESQSPEAAAKRKAEDDARHAKFQQEQQQRIAQRQAEEQARLALKYELRPVEINHASAAELARVCSLNADAAEMIIKEREKAGQFQGWPDLVHRVVAMSSAQSVVFASICGLTVNGQSFEGAPPDERNAQLIYQRYLR